MLWGDQSGYLAKTDTTTASNNINVVSTKFLQVGQKVQIRDRTTGALDTELTGSGTGQENNFGFITSVDRVNNIVQIAASRGGTPLAITTTTGQGINRHFAVIASGGASVSKETNGLGNLAFNATTGTIGGIDRAAAGNDFWQANQVDKSAETTWGVDLEDFLQETADEIAQDGKDPDMIITSYAQRRVLLKQLQTQRRFTPNTMDLKAGFKALDWDGIGVMVDRDASQPHGEELLAWYLFKMMHLMIIQTGEWKWINDDNAILYRIAGGDQDAVGATFRKYFNAATDRSNALGVLKTNTLATA